MSAYSKTTLAWGMPVKADELGAHLEAYSKCRPVIHMLRLCHRFGKGEKAFIRRLPLELLNLVEEELFEESRLQHYVEWAKDFRCYESRCSKKDHFSVQELQRFRAERDKSHCKSEGACSDEVDMDTLLLDRKDKEDVHTARFRSWEYRVTPYAQFEIYNKVSKDLNRVA